MNRLYVSNVKKLLGRMPSVFFGLLLVSLLPLPVAAQVLWSADTTRGTSVFEGLEEAPGTIGVAPDPLGKFGNVYKYDMTDTFTTGKERDESRGTKTPSGNFRMSLGGTYYIGWRAMWNPMPINQAWVALFQMHSYGPPGEGAPLVLRILNGTPFIQLQNGVNGQNVNFWSGALHLGVWNTFVLHVHLERDTTGWVELWYNGVQQKFINGATRYQAPLWDNLAGSYNLLKWGVYRTGGGDGHGPAVAYMSGAKIGLTFADVDPGGTTSGATSYEAEASGNTFAGAAKTAACSGCSGGAKVGFIGNGAANYLQINNISVAASGNYTLTIYPVVSGTRSFSISVDGGAAIPLTVSGTSWSAPTTPISVTIPLGAGSNSIKFFNDSAYGPDMDRITIQ